MLLAAGFFGIQRLFLCAFRSCSGSAIACSLFSGQLYSFLVKETKGLKVKLLFFASCRDIVGEKEMDFEVSSNANLGELKRILGGSYPRLGAMGGILSLAVNAEYANDATILQDGDEIAFIPPVSGG